MNTKVLEKSQRIIQSINIKFIRDIYHTIDWNSRLIGIVGQRGVGKTTLILQYLKKEKMENSLYFSADNINLIDTGLYNFVEKLYLENGIKVFFIDEIHKYSNWNQELKNLYDDFPKIKIVFSGSSSLDLVKGKYDLSRRVLLYKMQGLSFKEYLQLESSEYNFSSYSLEEILNNSQDIINKIYSSLGDNILVKFNQYLQIGYYPFSFESNNKEVFYMKLFEVINKLVYEDIANFYNLESQNLEKIKKIIIFYSLSKPGELSINSIKNKLGVSFDTAAKYLQILNDVGIIKSLYVEGNMSTSIRKADKIFIDNTNLIYTISEEIGKQIEIGTIREVFFVNQFPKNLLYSKIGDFSIYSQGKKYYFEIGGQNKKRKQLQSKENSFIISDSTIFSTPGKIPLWLFGFMKR